jgi:hypothetical protein
MSLLSSFAIDRCFAELGEPHEYGSGVKTPAAQRLAAANNLAGLTDTTASRGTPGTGVTLQTNLLPSGLYVSKLTLSAFALGNSGDNANLAIGAQIFEFPAGPILVTGAEIYGGVTAAISLTTDTPEIGLGTTVGTGAVATLSTTMEDIIDGGAAGYIGGIAVCPDVAGGLVAKGMLATSKGGVYIATSGGKAHTVFLNVADGWADVTAAGAVTFTGTVTLEWKKLSLT